MVAPAAAAAVTEPAAALAEVASHSVEVLEELALEADLAEVPAAAEEKATVEVAAAD